MPQTQQGSRLVCRAGDRPALLVPGTSPSEPSAQCHLCVASPSPRKPWVFLTASAPTAQLSKPGKSRLCAALHLPPRPAPPCCTCAPGCPCLAGCQKHRCFPSSTPADSHLLRDPGLPDEAALHAEPFPSTAGITLHRGLAPGAVASTRSAAEQVHSPLGWPQQNSTGGVLHHHTPASHSSAGGEGLILSTRARSERERYLSPLLSGRQPYRIRTPSLCAHSMTSQTPCLQTQPRGVRASARSFGRESVQGTAVRTRHPLE